MGLVPVISLERHHQAEVKYFVCFVLIITEHDMGLVPVISAIKRKMVLSP